MLTQEKLKELLHYDPELGVFTNIIDRGRAKIGRIAGGLSKPNSGYLRIIIIDNIQYFNHSLAFLYMEGYFPENDVDHIDQNKTNNKWTNLREVSRVCNMRNTGNRSTNKSGVKGVCLLQSINRWLSYIAINGKNRNLGKHKDFDEAVCHRLAGEQCLNWSGCNSSSPAFQYVQKMLNK